MRKRLTAALFCLSLNSIAQSDYPQNYFINPLKIPISLAGNFGECRPGHFHSGLDIKTNGVENYPVYAAADGYISRVKLEPGGFGHAIYITHPNGYTTLYAHLNDFFPALQQLVHQKQYAAHSWEQDLSFAADDFPVKQGQFIARSGNTGGSTAPHLHFEIRNSQTEHPLNPQLFGFTITDEVAPVPSSITIYDADVSVYEQNPVKGSVRKKGNLYRCDSTLYVSADYIKAGIAVNDYMNESDNTLSVYKAEWYWNDTLAGSFRLDDIGYDETRYLNACADYTQHYLNGIWYNNLFVLKGNKLGRLYDIRTERLPVRDSNQLRIVLRDAPGNRSEVIAVVRKKKVTTPNTTQCPQLWECGAPHQFGSPGCNAVFGPNVFYDDICFRYTQQQTGAVNSAIHRIQGPGVPLHTAFELSLKPDKAIPLSLLSKVCMRYTDGKDTSGKAVSNSNQQYTAGFRTLGAFWLDTDTVPPSIKVIRRNKKEIRLSITENKTNVQQMRGYLKETGQWLCFERHGKEWFYRFDEYFPSKKPALIEVEAIDENGNKSTLSVNITR